MPRHGTGLGANNFPAANKLLMRYEADRAYKLHMQRIANVKHRLDVKEPKKQNHLVLRLKQIQKEEERQAEIDHENKLLLSKMTTVMKYGGNIDNWNNYESRSLNYPFREKHNEEIARENIGIARRLETVRPKININAWERDYRKHAYLKSLWNESVKDFGEFTPRRFQSRMSRAVKRSMDSLNDTYDEDYTSVDTSHDDRKLPKLQLDKSKKPAYHRATKSETNGPVSSRRDQPAKSTKLPRINNKALIEHDYSMYYGSMPVKNLPDSERNKTKDKSFEDKPTKSSEEKQSNEQESVDKSPYLINLRELPKQDNGRKKHSKVEKKKSDSDKSSKNERKKDKNDDQSDSDKVGDGNDLEARSLVSFQSVNIVAGNDLERVNTLISEEKDKEFDNEQNKKKNESDNENKDGDINSTKDSDVPGSEGKSGNNEITTESKDDENNSDDFFDKNQPSDEKCASGSQEDNDGGTKVKDEDDKDIDKSVTDDSEGKEIKAIDSESQDDKASVLSEGNSGKGRENNQKEDGVTNTKKDNQETHDDKSDIAQLFKIAQQLGKPEEIFIKTLIKRTHKQRMITKTRFRQKYDLDLITELKNGLGQPWEHLIDALLQERGLADSYAVFDALSTADMSDVVELLCCRDNASIAELKESYRKEFSISLEEDISDRTKAPVQTLLLTLQKGGRDESTEADEKDARQDAVALYESGEGRWESESGKFIKLLNDRSFAHVRAVLAEFKSVSEGQDIMDIMKKECSKEYYKTISTLVRCVGTPAVYFAEVIHRHKLPTDPLLISILVTRSEIDMPLIRKAYKKAYHVDVTDEIKNKPHPTQKCLVELASKVPPGTKKGPDAKKTYTKGGSASQQSHPQPINAKKPPIAKKSEPSKSKGQGDTNASNQGESAVGSKKADSASKSKSNEQKSQQSKSKQDNQEKNISAKQKKAPVKVDGQHNGTVKPVSNFKPDDDCARLNSAMEGVGTDEQVIVSIIPKRSNKQRQQLKQTYEQEYKKNLMIDLESELTGDMEEIVLALMMTPTEYDAYVLHEAVEGLGSSEATLVGILCTRDSHEMKAIREHYKKAYKTDLEPDITRDTQGDYEALLGQLCRGEREASTSVNMKQAQQDAKDLYQDGAPLQPSNSTFKNLLATKNHFQVKATFEEYKKLSGHDIFTALSPDMEKDEMDAYISIEKAVEDPVQFYTEKLHDCFNSMGTNDNLLIRIVVSRSEVDLEDIKGRYMELYEQSLYNVVNRECRGDYKTMLLTVIDNPDANPAEKVKKPATKETTNKKAEKGEKTSAALSGGTVNPWQPFNPMEDSQRLYDGMKGFGTDEAVIIDIIPRRTNSQRQEIKAKYQDKYNKNLQEHLESELQGDFEEVVLALMMKPLDYDAHCLHAAVTGLGTDEAVLIGILSTRTGKELAVIKDRYKEVYGSDLQLAITQDVSGGLENMLVEILKCERDQGQDINLQEAKTDAKQLYKDGQISIDPGCETFKSILAKKSRAQVRATFEEYKKLAGNDIYYGIEKALIGDSERAYKGLAKAVEDPVHFYAERIHDCFEGIGTNDRQLIRIIISRSEIDLVDIKVKYKGLYQKTVSEMVKSECGGDYKRMLLAVLGDE